MASHWEEYLRRLERTLARPAASWSLEESREVWNSLAGGPVNQILHRYALRKTGNIPDAKDVVQQCFFELAIHRTYDPDGAGPAAFRIWIYGCLRRQVARHLERRKSRSRDVPLDDVIPGLSVDGKQAAVEKRVLLDQMIDGLAPRERDVMARLSMGQSYKQIACELNFSEVYVRQISSRAVRSLRKRHATPAD